MRPLASESGMARATYNLSNRVSEGCQNMQIQQGMFYTGNQYIVPFSELII